MTIERSNLESNYQTVWVFTGAKPPNSHSFPSGVFSTQANAEAWIQKHKLSGTLTLYRVDIGAYDHAVSNGYFRPTTPEHETPEFVATFSGGDTHFHYEDGKRG